MKTKLPLSLILLAMVFACQMSFAKQGSVFVSEAPFQLNYFIENKGQYDVLQPHIPSIDFYLESGSSRYYLTPNSMHILVSKRVLRAELGSEEEIEAEEARERAEEAKESAEGKAFDAKREEEEEEYKYVMLSTDVTLQWLHCNPNPLMEFTDKSAHYFSYGTEEFKSYGYKKVTYKELYPHIDLVYEVTEKGGVKYSLVLHPGANIKDIAYKYTGSDEVELLDHSLKIENEITDVFEKDLIAFDESHSVIDMNYKLRDGEIHFVTKDVLSPTHTYTIDPWVSAITTLASNNRGYDVDYDYAGNLYVYGGLPGASARNFEIAKYDAAGALLWTFMGSVVSPLWTTGSLPGNFVVDKTNGKVYTGQGIGSPASLVRLTTDGIYDSFLISMIGAQFEIWEMNYVCSSGQLLNMGGSTDVHSSIGVIDTLSRTCVMNNITGYAFTDQDILSSALDAHENLFVEMASVVDPRVDNHIMKVNSSYSSVVWSVPSGYLTFSEASNKPYGGSSNGFNALAANNNYVFYYDGVNVKAFDNLTGSAIGIPTVIPGMPKQQGGIFADGCNHVFVGGSSGNIKVFTFNGVNFLPEPDIIIPGVPTRHIYDLRYNLQTDVVYVSGDNFVATTNTGYFCTDTGLHVHTGPICPIGAYAYVDAYDPTALYTYTWRDTTTDAVIREVANVHSITDTVLGLVAGHFYTVSVIENSRCIIRKVVQFVTPTGTIINQNVSLCPGDSIKVGSHTYRTTSYYSDTFILSATCDSIVNTTLSVTGFITYSQIIYNCAGIGYTIGTHTYTSSGSYRDTIDRPGDCDSIMITNLIIFPPMIYDNSREICLGDTVWVGSHYYTSAGTYTDTVHIAGRCDSIVSTNIVIRGTPFTSIRLNICHGDTVALGRRSYSVPGSFYDTLDILGSVCDSILFVQVRYTAYDLATLNYSLCSGDSVALGSYIHRTAGTYHDTLHRAGRCDTAFTVIITVGARDTTTTNITVCDLDTIRYLGIDYLHDTTFMSQFARAGRCDSFTRVNLVFNPNPTRIENYTYCNGDSLRIRSKVITAPGVYYDTMRTPALCDTIYQYNVVRGTAITYTQNVARCAGDSLRVGTHVYTTGGVYRDTFVRGIGCDSVLISTLTIFPNSTVVLNPSICIYDSFRVGTNIYRTAGTYTDHLTNIYGCDSFITTNLSVLPLGTFAQNINICTGDTFVYNRHNYSSAGIYRDTLQRVGLCDSIVTTTLNLLALSAATQNISICTGDTFRVAAHTYTSAGIYRDTFVNAVGCDSVLTTNLSLRPILTYDEYDTICYEDSLFAHGAWRHTTGLYIDTLTSSIACDSFYKIHLQVLAAINATRNIYRCNGDSFLCGGAYQTTSGTYADTLSSTLRGCDSILQTVLLFYPATSDTFFKNICITDSFLAGGSYQDTSGTYTDTFTNSHGCDSVLFTILRVFPLPIITISNDTSVCLGKSVRLQASTNKPCSYLWNIGFSTPSITVGPVLSSTYFVKATDSLGCISYDSVDINIWPLPNVSIDDTTICIGQTARMQANSSTAVRYQWSTGDTTSNIIVHPATSNAYSVTVSDINNCQQHNSGHVTVSQPFVHIDAIPDSLINAGESVWLHAVYGFIDTSLIWSPAAGLSNTDSAYTEASPAYSTTYTVALIDENGCPTRDSINIIVIPKDIILVPTGFSPNGDGVNDVLKVVLSPHLELEEFRIYNRWGEEVFNYPKDNRGKGWDGMYKEREQPISTYVWYVVARNKFTGKQVNRNGNVTLLR